jgi:hypothetical protein
MPTPEHAAIWILRGGVLVTAVVFAATGQWMFGLFAALSVAVAVTPTLAARNARLTLPFEIELVLLWFMVTHLTLGYLFDLYTRITWYDKVLHFGNSVLVGFLAFLLVYVAHLLRHDRPHPWLDVVAILLVTLGLGSLWEIGEFASDQLFGTHTQGSPTLSPLVDTMWDLILDGAGGVLAAILGPIYIHRSKRSRKRVEEFADHLDARA